jgi:hypothetical protein
MKLSDTPRRAASEAVGLALFLVSAAAVSQSATSIEERIADLEAREAIHSLVNAYGHALDHRDFRAFAELFAEDRGTWVGGFGSATGRDAIFEMMDEYIGHSSEPVLPTSHHVFTNTKIDVDGDRAEGSTKWIFVVPSETGDPQWMFLGHYEDQFIRDGGHWFFLRREAFTDIPGQQQGDTE